MAKEVPHLVGLLCSSVFAPIYYYYYYFCKAALFQLMTSQDFMQEG